MSSVGIDSKNNYSEQFLLNLIVVHLFLAQSHFTPSNRRMIANLSLFGLLTTKF
ncbi:hypothetical protein BC833DRAFT_626780 [Globomyces pollinis-pini]|nr:hypothetical protein BC833DRAFT_626780 [Globomyces pollinis-pini]